MSADHPIKAGRRAFLGAGAAVLAGLAAPAWALQDAPEADTALGGTVRSNVSAFRALDWQDYFANTRNGVILCDTKSRALHFWSEDQTVYK
ncbi:MAG: L,D-transpeptidase, partial [Cereibacter sp.]